MQRNKTLLKFTLNRRLGFTLIEILIAVFLTGIITSMVMVPVVFAIRRVVDSETFYNDNAAMQRTLSFIGKEAMGALRLAPRVLKIESHQTLNGFDDYVLILASSAPSKQEMAAGSIVYKVRREGIMDREFMPGLYRWLLSGVMPEDIDTSKLKGDDSMLVLPDITSFKAEAVVPPDRLDEYSGALPAGVVLSIARGKGGQEEKLERFFAFP